MWLTLSSLQAALACSEHHHRHANAQHEHSHDHEADGHNQAEVATYGGGHGSFPSRPGAPNRAAGHESVTLAGRVL